MLNKDRVAEQGDCESKASPPEFRCRVPVRPTEAIEGSWKGEIAGRLQVINPEVHNEVR